GRTLTVAEDGDDTVAADPDGHLAVEVAKLLRDRECRVLLLEGKLGVGVHPLVELLGPPQVTPGPGAQGVDELRDRLWCGLGGGGGLGCRHAKTSFLQRSAFSRA